MHAPCTFFRGIQYGHRCRRRHRYTQPDQRGKSKAGKGSNLQPNGMPWTKVMDDCKGEKKNSCGNRRESDQSDVDQAVDFLPAAAVFAVRKVFFVVAAHFWRKAGNVIPPARQNLSYDWINTLLTHVGDTKSANPKPNYRRIGSNASVWDANNTRLQNSPPRAASAFSASLRAISG